MSDTSEYWHDVREWGKTRRAYHRKKTLSTSLAVLEKEGVKYEPRNSGLHLIIRTSQGQVNFYPTTGRYNGIVRGYGVEALIRDLKKLEKDG